MRKNEKITKAEAADKCRSTANKKFEKEFDILVN